MLYVDFSGDHTLCTAAVGALECFAAHSLHIELTRAKMRCKFPVRYTFSPTKTLFFSHADTWDSRHP